MLLVPGAAERAGGVLELEELLGQGLAAGRRAARPPGGPEAVDRDRLEPGPEGAGVSAGLEAGSSRTTTARTSCTTSSASAAWAT